jgi:3-deoxy-D-manno-octulosonate 8-phosphate phosphatase (KDO 8-P phosphatase)
MDVDGVLTDGKLHFTSDGKEIKTFDVLDGHGIAMAQRVGLTIGFIAGRPSKATTQRAADLGVKIVLQKPVNKMEMVEVVKSQHGFSNEEIAFMGDELVDLPVLRRVGLAVAVPNAVDEVRRVAHYVTRHRGGDGAVREVIEMILKARGSWKKAIAKYLTLVVTAFLFASPRLFADGNAKPAKDEAKKPADIGTGYIEKFEVPERDDDGNLKWKLLGERAVIRPDGLDRANNHATTVDHVRIDRENMVLTGIGGEWDGNTSSMVIRSNVCVVITNGQQTLGGLPKQP